MSQMQQPQQQQMMGGMSGQKPTGQQGQTMSGLSGQKPNGSSGSMGSTITAPGRGNQVPTSTGLGQYMTPAGPVERGLLSGNVPGTAFTSSIAGGQIPPGIMQQFQDQQRQQQARILEQFGGARFGTDALGVLGREQGRSLTNLLAGTENMGVGAQGQLYGQQLPLMQSELARTDQARNLQYQDFLAQSGLPPELAPLLAIAGLGGGTLTGRGGINQTSSTGAQILSGLL